MVLFQTPSSLEPSRFFETFAELAREYRDSEPGDFARVFPNPFLLQMSGAERDPSLESHFSTKLGRDVVGASSEDLLKLPIHLVVNSGRGSIRDMVTVGRSRSNDICLDLPNVSKFHAFFKKIGMDWWLTDCNSTNGSYVSGRRLEPRKGHIVSEAAQLSFDRAPLLIFKQSASVYETIQLVRHLL